MSRFDRRNWAWLPGSLRFRVLGLIDVAVLWVLVAALLGGGAWWGLNKYQHCDADWKLVRTGSGECIGVTAEPYPFSEDLKGVLSAIDGENRDARKPGKKTVSVAVMMPYTGGTGSAMSEDLIRHSLQGAYIAQKAHNEGERTKDTAIQLLFANVGKDLTHWQQVTDELASLRKDKYPVVAAIGLSNSDNETREAVEDGLAPEKIPAVSAVLSSEEMENPYLLKVSPSTTQLVDALGRYVDENEKVDRENTYMIADERKDNFVSNLSDVFIEKFGREYGISPYNNDSYKGLKGPPGGSVGIFRKAVDSMCQAGAKTVFLAGRDADLEAFMKTIASSQPCKPYRNPGEEPLRILRVSTGRDGAEKISEIARTYNIKIVTATAVDAPRWRENRHDTQSTPAAFKEFAEKYEQEFVDKEPAEAEDALDDGYAVLHHDALTAVSTALTNAVDSKSKRITHNVVYDQLRGGKPNKNVCNYCVRGASGSFVFHDESIGKAGRLAPSGLWPMCKPVPVVTFPDESDTEVPLYRTYQELKGLECPPP